MKAISHFTVKTLESNVLEAKQIVNLSTAESSRIVSGTLSASLRNNVKDKHTNHRRLNPKTFDSPTPKALPKVSSKGLSKPDWSESIQAVLEHPPAKLPRYLIGLGLVFSGIFIGWAYLGQMQEVSYAKGQLVPQGETYKVQPVLQGKVDSILVKEGDFVRKGEVIMTLDADRLKNELTRLEQSITATQTEQDQVRSLMLKTQQESEAQSQIATANIQAELAVLQQTESSINTSRELLSSLQSEMSSHEERFSRISTLESVGAISKEYLFGIEQGVREQQQAIVQGEGQLAESLAQQTQTKAQLAQKIAEMQQSESQAQQTLQKLRIEEQQLQATIDDISTQLAQAKAELEASYVSAPTAGILSNLAINNIGEVVESGQNLAEIVPEDTPLTLSAMVPHQEAGLLRVGMETQIKLDAFPYQNYGILSGEIHAISPDAKSSSNAANINEREHSSGYQVNISLDKDFVIHEQQRVNLQVGQTASAEVVIRRRRIIEIILDPIRQLKESNLSL
ncbi:MAG: HlyD family efflux transporter periplasmic adaptor subunit [Cyanobacteria bacterium J06621_11]